eukprot:1040444-Amphidinium_carterae.1
MVDVHEGDEGLCPSPEVRLKAQPGRTDGADAPRTPLGGRRLAEFHSPQFGGACALAAGASGDRGGGNGGSGPSSSRGDPLHRKDPWYGATTQTRRAGPQLRASGGGAEPPEPSDDGGGSDGRRNSRLPEDMLRSFRNRMRRLNEDMDSPDGDKPSGRGAGRRGHGGDGGDDGDDPSNPPSSSTSQAGHVKGMDQNAGLPTRRPRSRRS